MAFLCVRDAACISLRMRCHAVSCYFFDAG